MEKETLEKYLKQAEVIAMRAGAIITTMLSSDYVVEEKKPGDLVTEIDHAVDAYLKNELGALAPHFGWLSEETVEDPTWVGKEAAWVVDPVDGTNNMVRGGGREFAVSIAVVEKGVPVIGVIYNPVGPDGKGELISAAAGMGLRLNGRPYTRPAHSNAQKPRLVMSHSKAKHGLPVRKGDVDIIACGSIAYRMAMVALGRADIALGWYRKGNPWDIAGAHILCVEAGLTFVDANGEDISYTEAGQHIDGFTLAPPALLAFAQTLRHDLMQVMPKS